jgi:hypothetical protein
MAGGGMGISSDWIGWGGGCGGSGGAIMIGKTSFVKHDMAGDDDVLCVEIKAPISFVVPMDSREEHIV